MPGLGGVIGRPAALGILLSPARYYSPDYLRRVSPTLYGGAIAERPDLLDAHAALRSRHAPSVRGYLAQLLAVQTWSSLPYLHRVRARTLVLAGDDDPIVPPANGRILARLLPDARLQIIDGGGHLFLFVRAQEMAGIIRSFLDED
jgi:pimeloyl-ACP methyl ester carboxylesterase